MLLGLLIAVLLVGAGAAGSVLASTLSRSDSGIAPNQGTPGLKADAEQRDPGSRSSKDAAHPSILQPKRLVRAIADHLGKDEAEVVAQLKAGNTLAQIIEANGGSVDAVLDRLTAGAKEEFKAKLAAGDVTQEEMDQRLARLEERYTRLLHRQHPFPLTKQMCHWHRHHHHGQHHKGALVGDHHKIVRGVAVNLGLDEAEVAAQLKAGSTLAEVIEANGGSVDQVIADLTAGVKATLESKVAAGEVTQAQMDQRLAQMRQRLLQLFQRPLALPRDKGS